MPANTGKFLPVSVFGVPNAGIPVSVYTGLETLVLRQKSWQVFGFWKYLKLSNLKKYIKKQNFRSNVQLLVLSVPTIQPWWVT
jgi:hypothetical protein